jgi:hypothetical protein
VIERPSQANVALIGKAFLQSSKSDQPTRIKGRALAGNQSLQMPPCICVLLVEVVVGTQTVTSFDRMLFKGLALNTTAHKHDRKGIAINNAVDAFHQSQSSHFMHVTGIDEKIIYNISHFYGV